MFAHVAPPSVDLYTPSPQPELWRLVASPVPIQTVCGLRWSTVIEPIEFTIWFSNTAFHVTPLSVVFHSPPDAAAA